MAIGIYLHKYSKRVNSTANPGPGGIIGSIYTQIELKDATNLYTPTLIFKTGNWTSSGDIKNPMEYNYCYIPDFKRYYFIRTWSWILGRWECSLEIDVLGSHKSAIGDTTAYVLRSASEYNSYLIDTKYPTKSTMGTQSQAQATIWRTNFYSNTVLDGYFVLGIVNKDSSAIGATAYYAADGIAMRDFMSALYASPNWMNITDTGISNDLQKMLMNPIQYITTCMWVPSALDADNLTQITTIPVGWWSIELYAQHHFYKLTSSAIKQVITRSFDVPKHPAMTGHPELLWLQNSPYSQYMLRFYPFGVFPLDSAKLVGYDKVNCRIDLDLITGVGTLTVTRGLGSTDYPEAILYSGDAQVGIPISLAQMSVDMSRLGQASTWALSAGLALASDTASTSELVQSAKGLADSIVPDIPQDRPALTWKDYVFPSFGLTGQGDGIFQSTAQGVKDTVEAKKDSIASFLSAAGKVASNIGNAVLASSGTCHTTGTNGAIAQYTLSQLLTLFYFDIVPQDPVHYGYPLAASRKINTLSGFILCANEGDLSVAATTWERQAIAAAMKEGFYYE